MASRARSLIKAVRPVEFRVDARRRALGRARSAGDRGARPGTRPLRCRPRQAPGRLDADPRRRARCRTAARRIPAFSYAASDDETEEAIEDNDEGPRPLERAASLDAAGRAQRAVRRCRTGSRGRGHFTVDGPGARHVVAGPGRAGRRRRARRRVPRDRAGSRPPTAPRRAGDPAGRPHAGRGRRAGDCRHRARVPRRGADKNPVVLHTTTGTSPVRVPLPAALDRAGDPGDRAARRCAPRDHAVPLVGARDARSRYAGPVRRRTRLSCRSIADVPARRIGAPDHHVAGAWRDGAADAGARRGARARVVRPLGDDRRPSTLPVGDSACRASRPRSRWCTAGASPCCDASRTIRGAPLSISAAIDVVLDQAATKLAVTIEAPRHARPGGRARCASASGMSARPVQGEVTVWAVDEGLLALTAYASSIRSARCTSVERAAPGSSDTRSLLLGRRLPAWLATSQTSAAGRPLAEQLSLRPSARTATCAAISGRWRSGSGRSRPTPTASPRSRPRCPTP